MMTLILSMVCAIHGDYQLITHTEKIKDYSCIRDRDVAIRVLTKDGKPEQNIEELTRLFTGRKQVPTYYGAPCVKCGNILDQASDLCNKVLKPCLKYFAAVYFFIDVTDPAVWSKDQVENIAALEDFSVIIRGCSDDFTHYYPNILTNKQSWERIMGPTYDGFYTTLLWHMNLDGKMDHSDFVPFGGWRIPKAKTYKLVGRDECGNENVMKGFW